jgi:hypothetical protein
MRSLHRDTDIINAACGAHEATRLTVIHAPPTECVSAYHAGFIAGIIALCAGVGISLRLNSDGTLQRRLPQHTAPRVHYEGYPHTG